MKPAFIQEGVKSMRVKRQAKINRNNVLEAEQADYSANSFEIRKETDEIKSVIDSEFVDFKDA